VSDVSGEAEFFISEEDAGSSLLAPLANQTSWWLTPSSRGAISVQTTRLDDWLVSRDPSHVELLKSEARGFDGKVIESAGKFLSPDSIGALLVELNFHSLCEGQDSFYGIIETLGKKGLLSCSDVPPLQPGRMALVGRRAILAGSGAIFDTVLKSPHLLCPR